MAMADGRSVAKLNKPRRKKENPASSSSSSSSPLSLQCDVEIESIDPGKHKTKPKLMGASAATKSRSGGRGEDLIHVSPSRVSCSSFVCFHYTRRANSSQNALRFVFLFAVRILFRTISMMMCCEGALPTFEDTAAILWVWS